MTTPAYKHGRGPRKAIVMNGWLGTASHWRAMLEAIDPERFEIAVFDYRGYGTRCDVAGDFTFDEAAHDLLAFVDALAWQRFSLVGHSMGGMAMQRVALCAPDRVERLVGLAPVPAAGSRMDDTRLALFGQAVTDAAVRARIVDFSTGHRRGMPWAAAIARDSQANRPDAMAGYLQQWAVHGFADEARGLGLPVAVFVGEHDPSIHAELAERTWRVDHPQATVEVVPGAGHYPMLEVPTAMAARLQHVLSS